VTASWQEAVSGSYTAAADLSALQYQFVKFNSSGGVVAIAAVTDIPAGVLQNQPKSGQIAEVLIVGGTKLKASAAIALPALLGVDTTGRGKKIAAGTDTTQYIVGFADGEQGIAGATGDIIAAVVNCASPARAA
jgi:hypothetical protein